MTHLAVLLVVFSIFYFLGGAALVLDSIRRFVAEGQKNSRIA